MMMNELNIPEAGVGPEGQFTVECLGRSFQIRYVANMRTGVTLGMIIDTIRHFRHAVQCIAKGHTEPATNVKEREDWHEQVTHGEARTNTWTFRSCAVVPVDGNIFKVPINLCNEFTSAEILMNMVWGAVEVMKHFFEDFEAAGSIIKLSQPTTQQSSTVQPAQEQPVTDNSHKATNPADNIVHLGAYDYRQRDDYETKYVGRTVSVDISSMHRRINARKDGSGSYECIELYGYYNSLPSDKPIYDLRVFVDIEQKWNNFQALIHKLPAGVLGQVGDKLEQPCRLFYKLNRSKKEDDDTIYWNIVGSTFLDDSAEQQARAEHGAEENYAYHEQMASQKELDDFAENQGKDAYYSPDEIPF
jgi:hypothetical protein